MVSRSTFLRMEKCLDDFIEVLLALWINLRILGRWSLRRSIKTLGGVLGEPGSFYSRGSLFSSFNLTNDRPVGALEAEALYTRESRLQTEVIFSKRAD